MRRSSWHRGWLLAVVLLWAPAAGAGDCPVCTSSADCGGNFCVLHRGPIGCGTRMQVCCPGQACALGPNGRPTCETAGTCTVVSGPSDGGAGVPIQRDSGFLPPGDSAVSDTGAPSSDAPTTGDAATTADAGPVLNGTAAGCGCHVANNARGAAVPSALAGLALLLRRRRAAR